MQVLIDDMDTPLMVNSLDISKAIGQRSTGNLLLRDDAGVYHYDDGQRLDVIASDGTRVYSGVLDGDGETKPGPAGVSALLVHAVGGKDWHYLADKRLVAKSYAAGQTCGAIFRDLLSTVLAAEGVTSKANYLSVNQSNVETDTTGFATAQGATISRTTTEQWQGSASLSVVCPGLVASEGFKATLAGSNFVAGGVYTFSAYVKGAGTVKFICQNQGDFSTVGGVFVTQVLTGAWQRISITVTLPASIPSAGFALHISTFSVAQAVTFYADGLQIELGTRARPWAVGQSDFIADGIVLPDVVFNYATAAACADAIAQRAGAYWWQIDEYKQLWFQPYAAIPAPWALTADANGVVTDARHGTVKVKRGKPLYRNRQYVINVTDLTATQVETRVGDGANTSFSMSYALAKVPTVEVKIGAGSFVTKTVGIGGVDSAKDWYWNAGKNEVFQDSGGTKLTSADTLRVTYVGQYPVTIVSEDTAQVLAQQALEGGGTTGYVEDVLSDPSITTRDAAFQKASALLARFAQKAAKLTFQTSRAGLEPGQLLTVNIPAHDLNNAQLLIESVRITDEDGILIWYDVTALLGPVNTTWVQFFGTLIQQAQVSSNALSVGSSATLVVAQTFSENWGWTESLTPRVNVCPICGPATICGPSLIVC